MSGAFLAILRLIVRTRTLASHQEPGQATVARIYQQFTIRKAAERLSLDRPRYLGIDEPTFPRASASAPPSAT